MSLDRLNGELEESLAEDPDKGLLSYCRTLMAFRELMLPMQHGFNLLPSEATGFGQSTFYSILFYSILFYSPPLDKTIIVVRQGLFTLSSIQVYG